MADTPADICSTSALLVEAFGNGEVTSERYLDWLYLKNPAGPPVEENLNDAEGRIGHYAVIPKLIQKGTTSWRIGLSLNTAVAARARGRGLFTSLATAVLARSQVEGLKGIVGVANANSTPGFVGKLGFHLEQSLPVKVGVAAPVQSKELMVAAMISYGATAVLWIYILRTTPLAKAYVFSIAGSAIVPIIAYMIFKEPLTAKYWAGFVLVLAGVYLCASAS